jgi:hypothetical protein
LAEKIRIIYRRCDNIGRGDDGRFIREPVDSGIVAGIKADQQVRILVFRQPCNKFSEPDRVDFRRSPAGF